MADRHTTTKRWEGRRTRGTGPIRLQKLPNSCHLSFGHVLEPSRHRAKAVSDHLGRARSVWRRCSANLHETRASGHTVWDVDIMLGPLRIADLEPEPAIAVLMQDFHLTERRPDLRLVRRPTRNSDHPNRQVAAVRRADEAAILFGMP